MILPRDLLLLAGGKAVDRFGTLVHGPSTMAFSRAGAANFTDRNLDTMTAAANVPRLDWQNADGNGYKPYLLIEAGESCSIAWYVGSDVDLTVHIVIARPSHADAGGDIGSAPGLFSLGGPTEVPHLGCYFDQATRVIRIAIERPVWDFSRDDGPTFDSDAAFTFDATEEAANVSQAVPVGDVIAVTVQFNATTARARINVGAGWSSYFTAPTSGALAGSWGARQFLIGDHADPLLGAIRALAVARGLYEPAEFAEWTGD